MIQELNGKTGNRSSFEKRFFHWVDGFFAFKFANYVREYHYPAVPVDEAASWLLMAAYEIECTVEVEKLLMEYRVLDKISRATV
jgi:hypothetical protein